MKTKRFRSSFPSFQQAGPALSPGSVRPFSRAALEDLGIRREAAIRYAWAFLGLPYRWGGDDPIKGFDCSGLIIEILTGVGILPHKYDNTAGGLWADLIKKGAERLNEPRRGAVCFFKNQAGNIIHVEIAVEERLLIGASGGGSSTTDLEAAEEQNAFVKLRPFGYRGQDYLIADPFSGGPAMTMKEKAKAAASTIVSIVAALLGIVPGIFKKKAYTLWQWDVQRKTWINHGTFSARQCKKLRKELIRLGQDPATFTILRKGAVPPHEGPK